MRGRGARSIVCSSLAVGRLGGWRHFCKTRSTGRTMAQLSKERPARARFTRNFGLWSVSNSTNDFCLLPNNLLLLPLLITRPVRNIQKEQPTAPSHCSIPPLFEYLVSKSEPQYLRPAHPAPANPFLYAPWRTSSHLSENCICVPEPRKQQSIRQEPLCIASNSRSLSLQPVSYSMHIHISIGNTSIK